MKEGVRETQKKSPHGYWLYKNGNSHWGINLYKVIDKEWETGISITQEQHNMTVENKIQLYQDTMDKINKEKAEKEAKEKAKIPVVKKVK